MRNGASINLQRLEKALVGFFLLCGLSIVVVYIVDPALYAKALQQPATGDISLISLPGLFLIGILGLISTIIYGVIHHWRWLYWLLLLALCSSILELPVTLLQFAGIVPDFFGYPLWYNLYRLAVSFFEVGLGIWMLYTYRKYGIWASGKSRAA